MKIILLRYLGVFALVLAFMAAITGCNIPSVQSVKLDPNALPKQGSYESNWRFQKNEGMIYFLPTGYIELVAQMQKTSGTNSNHYSFTLTPVIVPDYKQAFLLRQSFSPYAHDSFQFAVANNGLLTSVNTTNQDQTGQIIVQIAQTVAAIVNPMPPGLRANLLSEAPPSSCERPDRIDLIFDPSQPVDAPDGINSRLAKYCLKVHVEVPSITWGGGWQDANTSLQKDKAVLDGIYYRCKLPYTITIEDESTGDISSTVALLPNRSPILSMVPRRSSMVTRTTSITLQDGCLTSVAFDKPSTALAWVSLPLTVMQALMSVPTQMLQLKLNYANTNQALIQADTATLQNELNLLKAQMALVQFNQTNNVPSSK